MRPCGCGAARRGLQAGAQSLPREETGRPGSGCQPGRHLMAEGDRGPGRAKENSGSADCGAHSGEARVPPQPLPTGSNRALPVSRDVGPGTLTISGLPGGPGVLAVDLPEPAGNGAAEAGPPGAEDAEQRTGDLEVGLKPETKAPPNPEASLSAPAACLIGRLPAQRT
ncbi:uncharacterized protein LOC118149127 [Callithrix jacchus]|uniref:collagen alpha-1(I) chain n=1 Tax=Callithrix jacchus TaxID=9483 RepID=UPI00159EAD86|nr:collagen alpha-1(I) chain [Callithrix jacchus]